MTTTPSSIQLADAIAQWLPNFGFVGAAPADWPQDRPLRLAVLGDFSAAGARGQVQAGTQLAGSVRAINVEFDSVDAALARLAPRLTLPLGPQGKGLEIHFESLDDFHPDALFDRLPIFKALADLRQRLLVPATFAAAAAELALPSSAPVAQATPPAPSSSAAALPGNASLDDFARLLGRPAVITAEPEGPVADLLRHVVAAHVQPAADPRRDDLVASVDTALAELMRSVLHHPQFQALESLWRGLDLLLRRVETGAELQVHLLDVSALSCAADLAAGDDLARSGLYQLLVEQAAQRADGGYDYVLGAFEFDATPPQIELLGRMAQVAQAAGAVFISSIHAQDFSAAPDAANALHPMTARAWQALRALPAAAHLALAAPRFMLRYPYGKRSDPIARFAFEEFNEREGLRALLWGHPAWLLAAALLGPDPQEGDATLDDLPFHYAIDTHGDQVPLPCTDRWTSTDAATRLAGQGLIAVLGHRGLPQVRLAPLQTVNGRAMRVPSPATRERRVGGINTPPNPRGALSGVLEAELNSLLAQRAAPITPQNSKRDPGLDALISASS